MPSSGDGVGICSSFAFKAIHTKSALFLNTPQKWHFPAAIINYLWGIRGMWHANSTVDISDDNDVLHINCVWSCVASPTYLLTYTHKTHLSSFQPAIINQWKVTQSLTSSYLATFNQVFYFPRGVCSLVLWLNNLTGHLVAQNSNCFSIEAQA